MTRPLLVTAALPYANGPLHFGHVAGAYLPADIFTRYQRLRGTDVLFMCGTDEHGVAITMKAEQEGKSFQEYVDHWHSVISGFFDQLQISFDTFSQTSHRDPHYPLSQEFFLRLLENKKVLPSTTQQHYCTFDKRFLPDRFVTGTCYLCHAEGARGDECKTCGQWLDATKLINPRCAQCGREPELRETTQYELQLTSFEKDPAIRDWYQEFSNSQKQNVKTFVVNKMVEGEGLKPRAITRDLPWGVPVPSHNLRQEPLADVDNKVLYVWFDAPIGYITATIEWARQQGDPDGWRRYWIRRDDETGPRLIHFIGKDNIPFHCIVFPSMLAWQTLADDQWESLDLQPMGPGKGEKFVLPEAVPANEFYNLEGKKFNTSDGWFVDPEVFGRYSADQIRYYLTCSMPETADTNFLWKEFQARNNELADTFGNFAARVLRFVERYRENAVPEVNLTAARRYQETHTNITQARDDYEAALEGYQFRKGVAAFMELCRYGNRLINEEKPWELRKTDPAACDECLAISLWILKAVVPMLHPFIPTTAATLAAMLGLEGITTASWDTMLVPLPGGHQLGEAGVLIPKIDDETVQKETDLLESR